MDRGDEVQKKVHPRERANLFSLLSFFYMRKIFVKAFKRGLVVDDLYEVPGSLTSKTLGDQLEKEWESEEAKREKPSIFCAIWRCHWRTYVVLGLMQFTMKTITTIWSPKATSKLISYFSPEQEELTKNDAIFYACIVIGLGILNLFYYNNYWVLLGQLAIRVRTAVSSLLYRKSLKLSTESLMEISVGKITTIMTKDIESFEILLFFGNDIWIGFFQTILTCYLLYNKVGVEALVAAVFFTVLLPVQMFVAKKAYALRLECSKRTDERLEIIQEALSAIKIIKMYTWEKFFEQRVNAARKKELSKMLKIFFIKVFIFVAGTLSSKLVFFLFLIVYVYIGHNVTAETIYFVIGSFSNLEYTLSYLLPYGLCYLAEFCATAKRIETVLSGKELQQSKPPGFGETSIILKELSAKIGKKTVFDDVSLEFMPGLNAVTGHMGVGKTTLLKTILQDCDIGGELKINGRISYASQEPWLFPATIKNNILFGEKFNEVRYRRVLEVCALIQDLESFPEYDSTVLGEKGINLSKGQQCRINLARAVYRDGDIYLLDDCLAALDANVSDSIFEKCFKRFLAGKLIVYVTNNPNHQQQADNIVTINDGKIEIGNKQTVHCKGIDMNNSEMIKYTKEEKSKRIYDEVQNLKKVNKDVYKKYIRYGGGFLVLSGIVAIFVVAQSSNSYSDKLMSSWVTLEQNLTNFKAKNMTNTTKFDETYIDRTNTLKLYITMVSIHLVVYLLKSLIFYNFTRTASNNIHRAMVKNIFNAKMNFFDTHFIGNILNRFSKDYLLTDEYLPFFVKECIMMIFVISGGVALLTNVNILFLFQSLAFLVIVYLLRHFYQPAGRNLYRLDALTRSPMLGHLKATMEGLTTIRASNAQEIVKGEYDKHQNLYSSAYFTLFCTCMGFSFALEFAALLFETSIITRLLVTDFDREVGDVGLAITQSFQVSNIITHGMRSLFYCENYMTAVERILQYTEIDTEDKINGQTPKNWPSAGSIKFDNVSLNYDRKPVLKNINFTIAPGEKIGIVGRTGAGKSSIVSSLFRLYDIAQGQITIDGIDIKDVNLELLRTSITAIPQDPVLFTGTIRDNLDPFREKSDGEIWQVLEKLKLKHLDLDGAASSFSSGQKQLLCLARAMLNKTKIVILDEATANVDQETDALIHKVVKEDFAKCTVILIAHRIVSVMKCNKVIVLSRGELVEFDEPSMLLRNLDSFLHYVVKSSNSDTC